MPITITFQDARTLSIFHAMAEGIEEVQRDNGDPESRDMANALIRLIDMTGAPASSPAITYPLTVELAASMEEAAQITFENCLDESDAIDPQSEDAEDYIFPGQIAITITK